jgi:hypothetical protein
MEKVMGIGGVFFRAKDPQGLARWYRAHWGIDVVPTDYETPRGSSKQGRRRRTVRGRHKIFWRSRQAMDDRFSRTRSAGNGGATSRRGDCHRD